jgi:hypothetical protein
VTTTVYYDGIEVTGESFDVDIRRGRSRTIDEFEAASGYVRVRNVSRNFDPPFFTTPSYLLLESGDFVLLETGDRVLLEQGSFAAGSYGQMQLGKTLVVMDGSVTVFAGHVEDINYRYDVGGYAEATFVVGDPINTLARTSIGVDVITTDAQTPGARIAAVLDRSDVNFPAGGTYRSIATGHARLVGDTIVAGTNVLQYLQLVARTDAGKLYTDRTGKLVYKGRYDWPGESGGTFGNSSADFTDTVGATFAFSSVQLDYGSELLTYQATVTRVVVPPPVVTFGVVNEDVDPDVPVVDSSGTPRSATAGASPPPALGARNLSMPGLLLRNDSECEARASYIVDRYSVPEGVISSLSTYLEPYGSVDRAVVAALDINDVVTVTWTPNNTGTTVTQTLAVEGVTYSKPYDGLTTVTLQLSEMPNTNFFRLDVDSLDGGVPLGF